MSLHLKGWLTCLRSGCDRGVEVQVRLEIERGWDPEQGATDSWELKQIIENLPAGWTERGADDAYCPEHGR